MRNFNQDRFLKKLQILVHKWNKNTTCLNKVAELVKLREFKYTFNCDASCE